MHNKSEVKVYVLENTSPIHFWLFQWVRLLEQAAELLINPFLGRLFSSWEKDPSSKVDYALDLSTVIMK